MGSLRERLSVMSEMPVDLTGRLDWSISDAAWSGRICMSGRSCPEPRRSGKNKPRLPDRADERGCHPESGAAIDLKAAKASAKTKATVARPHFLKRLEQGLRHHVLRPLVAGLRPRRKVLHHAPPVMAPMETAPRATAPQRTTQPKAKPAPATRR